MITLTESQYQEFQNALKWDMAERLPDGRILGCSEKLGWIKDGPDHKVAYLAQRVPLHDKTVVELGSYEGDLTVQLAKVSKFVTGLEVRPSNILCSLTRLFVHDVTNARILLKMFKISTPARAPLMFSFMPECCITYSTQSNTCSRWVRFQTLFY